jgi:hypothetical protein
MTLQYINPLQLNSVWDIIKPGIENILEELNTNIQREFWIPEDVFHQIKEEKAVLLTCPEGWVVIRVDQDKYSGVKVLRIWLAYAYNQAGKDIRELAQNDLDIIAKNYGCSFIEWQTTRRGWDRLAPPLGYVPGLVTYLKRI